MSKVLRSEAAETVIGQGWRKHRVKAPASTSAEKSQPSQSFLGVAVAREREGKFLFFCCKNLKFEKSYFSSKES